MNIKEIEIHPGHWVNPGSGANGIIKEVSEARKVAKRVYEILIASKVPVTYIEDNTSTNQSQNINYLVKEHNKDRDGLIVSIHFNSSGATTDRGIGTEVLYYSEKELAEKMALEISNASKLLNRGARKRIDLGVLAKTYEPAILIEVCFVNSKDDVERYKQHFEEICQAIAKVLAKHIGYKINSSKTYEQEKEEITLTETGREEARALIRKAVKKGVFSVAAHTEEKIKNYTDTQLLSYTIAYINRTSQ